MNYAKYYQTDVLNGLGTRCVLFVSGCAHHCKGCFDILLAVNDEDSYCD